MNERSIVKYTGRTTVQIYIQANIAPSYCRSQIRESGERPILQLTDNSTCLSAVLSTHFLGEQTWSTSHKELWSVEEIRELYTR